LKFEQTVQHYFDTMPKLFQTRVQVLEHLFVVIGNGYDWIDGQLVYDSYYINEDEIVLKSGYKAKQNIIKDDYNFVWNTMNKDIESISYPLFDTSNLFTFTDDIKEDWLEGVRETVILLLQREVDKTRFNDYLNEMDKKTSTMLNQLANKLGIV